MQAISIVQGIYKAYGVYSQKIVTKLNNLLKLILGVTSVRGLKLFKGSKVF
jgi:hypothetical protein